jgi:hypothetical protein
MVPDEDVLVVACGGAAKNALKIINSEDDDPWQMHQAAMEEFGHRFEVLSSRFSTVPMDDPEKIRQCMEGKRVVVPFSILGGDVGTDIIKEVIRCARDIGCKVVSVFGIPMGWEPDRRERAFRALPEVASLSDCCLVVDMQKLMDVNLEFDTNRFWKAFLKMSDNLIRSSIWSIVEYMQGPFFTVFTERMYAFVVSTDVLPVNAVLRSWGHLMFDNNPALDSLVIMVGANITTPEIEEIRNRMVIESGIMPEVIRRNDPDDSKVMIFRAVRSF